MKNRILYLLLVFLYASLVSGCLGDELSPVVSDRQIRLSTYVPSPIIATKAAGIDYIYDYFEPTGNLEFSFIRWNQGGSNDPVQLFESNLLNATLGDPVPTDSWKRYVNFETVQFFDNDHTKECGFAGCYPSINDARWDKTNFATGRKLAYNIDGKTDVMFSDFKKGNYNTGIEPLTFKHALCLYKIYAYAVDQDSKDEWGKIDAVTFINLPVQLNVTLPEDITVEGVQPVFFYSEEYAKQHIILDPALDGNSDGVVDELDAKGYPKSVQNNEGLSIPAGYSADNLQYVGAILGGAPETVLGINVTMDDPDIIAESAVSIARDFQPGYTYNIILRFSTHGIVNASVTVEDWPDEPIEVPDDNTNTSTQRFFTNLSRYGTANSYVVSSANMGYAFDCTKKGNGINTLTDWKGDTFVLQDPETSINPSDIDKVEVIWSDVVLMKEDDGWKASDSEQHNQELITLVSDKPVDNMVLFEVVGFDDSEGNEDYRLKYKGNALIGAYDKNGDLLWSWHIWVTDKPLNLNYGNGFTSQDRNLGALSSDPNDFVLNKVAVSGLCYQWGRKDPFNPNTCNDPNHLHTYKVSIADGQKGIDVAHKNPLEFYVGDGSNWCYGSNDYMWGYLSDQDETVKTMYDPCPPGYRVNGNSLWEIQSNESSSAPDLAGQNRNAGYLFDIGNRFDIYYPASSYFNANGGVVNSSDVYQYSANPGYSFHYPPVNAGQTLTQVNRAEAHPVRCVLENSKKAITDLSREQTANCYIVENSGYYKFNAKIPGNGVGSIGIQAGEGVIKKIDVDAGVNLSAVAKVDVLWWQGDLTSGSSYMDFVSSPDSEGIAAGECPITIMDYNSLETTNIDDDGYAYFQIEKSKMQNANVILAGFDINGNILWTWHIWMLPDGLDLVRFGQYSVMDRNVGATFAPTSATEVKDVNALSTYGFYYQWGRKDPFVPPHVYNPTGGRTSSPWFYKNPSTGEWEKKSELLANERAESWLVTDVIKNPTVLYYKAGDSWQTTYSASAETDGPVGHMWGYTGLDGVESYSAAKTMWDPCPPGYKLIDHTVIGSSDMWNRNPWTTEYDRRTHNTLENDEFGLYVNGETFWGLYIWGNWLTKNYIQTDNRGFWLPYSRGISDTGEYVTSDEGRIHTACPFRGFKTRTFLYNYEVFTHSVVYTHSIANTVRCQKE